MVDRYMALSRSELLPDTPPAAWVDAERRACRRETVRAALAASAVLQTLGADGAEQQLLETALHIEPLAEDLAQRLMRSWQRAGRASDALRVYERLREDLQRAGAAPSSRTEAVWREVLASARA